jgi:hypothetical protein
MEKDKLIWILFGLSAVLLIFSAFSLLTAPIGIKEYDVRFIVEEGTVGFDLNNTSLTFGKIPPGGSGTREIVLDNYDGNPIDIEILATKEIIDFLVFQPIYTIPPMSNVTVQIIVAVPEEAENGEYRGKIQIRKKK